MSQSTQMLENVLYQHNLLILLYLSNILCDVYMADYAESYALGQQFTLAGSGHWVH